MPSHPTPTPLQLFSVMTCKDTAWNSGDGKKITNPEECSFENHQGRKWSSRRVEHCTQLLILGILIILVT